MDDHLAAIKCIVLTVFAITLKDIHVGLSIVAVIIAIIYSSFKLHDYIISRKKNR